MSRWPVLALVLALAVPMVASQTTPVLQVTPKVEPAVLAPGTQGVLTLSITNAGTGAAGSVQVAVGTQPAGITIGGQDSFFGALGPAQTTTLSFLVTVAGDVVPGRHLVGLVVQYCATGGACNAFTTTINLLVQDPQTLLVEELSPAQIRRSQLIDLGISLRNPTGSAVKDVDIAWTAPLDAVLPLGRESRVTVPLLGAGETIRVSFPAVVDALAPAGPLPVTITTIYTEIGGGTRTATHRAGLLIGGVAVFDAGDARIENDVLTFTLANIAQDGATSVVVRALGAGEVVGTTYLGTMEPSDFATISMPLTSATITGLRVEHTDELGVRHADDVAVDATYVEPDAQESGPSPLLIGVGAVAAVVVVLLVVSRLRRRAA